MTRANNVTGDNDNGGGAIIEPPREPVPQAGSPLRVETRAGSGAADDNTGAVRQLPDLDAVPQAASSMPTDAAPADGNS